MIPGKPCNVPPGVPAPLSEKHCITGQAQGYLELEVFSPIFQF